MNAQIRIGMFFCMFRISLLNILLGSTQKQEEKREIKAEVMER